MKKFIYLILPYILVICHKTAYGIPSLDEMRQLLNEISSDEISHDLPDHIRTKRSNHAGKYSAPDTDFITEPEDEDFATSIVHKRQITDIFQAEYCLNLGATCAQIPELKVLCLLKCYYRNAPLKFYTNMIPHGTLFACQSANTVFATLPPFIVENENKIVSTNQILTSIFSIPPAEYGDFAKSASNALLVSMIKHSNGDDFTAFKSLVTKLETHDTDQEVATASEIMQRSTLSQLISTVSSGDFVNKNCDPAHLNDETLIVANAIEQRLCLLEFLIPGYFVLNRAPSVASTKRIAPMLRAWNMPLYLFTGVSCCLTRFAEENQVFTCAHEQKYFDKPHGFSEQPDSTKVCGAISSVFPSTFVPGNDTDIGIGISTCNSDYDIADPDCVEVQPTLAPDQIDYSGEDVGKNVTGRANEDEGEDYQ